MAIDLFKHNCDAYYSAVAMLEKTGKAAVVHPTGTGKSFIGFKLCEDNPDKRICWLSPSEYIFKTQLENLRKCSDGYIPDNIIFFTYAKLMNIGEEELIQIQPDYIILDEFHRCGAKMWGGGVDTLLQSYPDTPILGLSATAVRYLDNQRNMADELFDGCVASNMTLGEAVVKGILAPPKYVLAVFAYEKQLKRYEHRVRSAKNKAVRDEGQKYLDALRRTLEKSEGIDAIFDKHITDRSGKYLVFCADYDHMCSMVELAREWFKNIDNEPHIYKAYSDDPETDASFAAFKKDTSKHIKLLFCIDMLNEGVHVDDISGVILLRPTVSPIVYKQQIGRALAAGRNESAVIFDIVLNIDNLYSIDAIEEEMQIATSYYRSLGCEDDIVNEHFRITDEVRDCRELFDRLNDTLGASWELMYRCAEDYYRENGNIDVPKRYVTAEGYTLGSWIATQRLVYQGKVNGRLSKEQISALEAIGMRWESVKDLAWERYYSAACAYFRNHGDLLVNITENNYCGVALGPWIANLRSYRKNGIKTAYLTPERIEALDRIGMVWSVVDYLWERNYSACVRFHSKHGHLDVPATYVDDEGIRLGSWIFSLRAARANKNKRATLTDAQINRLDSLGMLWGNKQDIVWQKNYAAVCTYKRANGHLNIPVAYETAEGLRIGRWLRLQREMYEKGTLIPERKQMLDLIGMNWKSTDQWEEKYLLVKDYYNEHGHTNIPSDYVCGGVWLYRWLYEQRKRLDGKGGKMLSVDQQAKLAGIGVISENIV
ncbi:MAG: Helicase associated domain protein [Clostridia bacterium]|nr:Helicase associated domain protein [Clostridia bacterium]